MSGAIGCATENGVSSLTCPLNANASGDFWTIREEIARNLTDTLNQTMYEQTHVLFPQLQLLEVDFSTPYEDMIENIQLQVRACTCRSCCELCSR